MSNVNRCSRCLAMLPENQLYFIRKNWVGVDVACMNCIKKPSCKLAPPLPLLTLEQYLFSQNSKPVVRTVDQASTSRSVEGVATINNQQYTTILEEETVVTRRVILKPPS